MLIRAIDPPALRELYFGVIDFTEVAAELIVILREKNWRVPVEDSIPDESMELVDGVATAGAVWRLRNDFFAYERNATRAFLVSMPHYITEVLDNIRKEAALDAILCREGQLPHYDFSEEIPLLLARRLEIFLAIRRLHMSFERGEAMTT